MHLQSLQTPDTWSVARKIVKHDGFGTRGLLKGITATLARHGLFNAVYFGSFYNMKLLLVSPEVIPVYVYMYIEHWNYLKVRSLLVCVHTLEVTCVEYHSRCTYKLT